MTKVLIAPAPLDGIDAEFRHALVRAGFDLIYPKLGRQMVETELVQFLPGIKASLAGSEPYSRRVFEIMPELRIIARVGVGYDAVDVPAATEHGVVVAIAPGTNQDSVAEHTFMLILALAKDLINQHLGTRAGRWPRRSNLPL